MFTLGFNKAKFDTKVKLCQARINLQRNKKAIGMKQMRRQIAEQLKSGQTESARIRVESVIRDSLLLQAYNILELYLELFSVRSQLISKTKEIPRDLTEAVSSVIYAARRISDVPELGDLAKLFAAKYGKEFAHEAAADAPTCNKWSVNANIVRCLLVEPPQGDEKLAALSEIAQEYEVMFDAAGMGRELMAQGPPAAALVPPIPSAEDPERTAAAAATTGAPVQSWANPSWAAEQDHRAAAEAAAQAAQQAQLMAACAALAQKQAAYIPLGSMELPPEGWLHQQAHITPTARGQATAGPSAAPPTPFQPQAPAPLGAPQQPPPGYVVRSADEIQRAYDAAVGPPQKGALVPPQAPVAPAAAPEAAAAPSVPTHAHYVSTAEEKAPSAPALPSQEEDVFAELSRRLENLKSK